MADDLISLVEDIIRMRKYPLQNDGVRRYPAAAQAFTEKIQGCDDPDILREIIYRDTGHVLPVVAKQHVYEKLLAHPDQRTPDILRAYAMHLVMFGYTTSDGQQQYDTDEMMNALYDEAGGSE